jgi:hypothetical protein
LSPSLVDQASKRLKEFGRAVNFVENHQPVGIGAQEQRRRTELFPIFARFEVKV